MTLDTPQVVEARPRASWKWSIVIAVSLLMASVGWAWWRFGSLTAVLDAVAGASLLVDSDGRSLGRVDVNEVQRITFRFSNRSDRAILLLGGKVSCNCLRPETLPITLAPGESRPFEVRFKPKPKVGPVSETLTLYSDDPQRPFVLLRIEADIVGVPQS